MDPHSVSVKVGKKKKKRLCKYKDQTGFVEFSHPCKNKSHTQILCVNVRSHISFPMLNRFTQRGLQHIDTF